VISIEPDPPRERAILGKYNANLGQGFVRVSGLFEVRFTIGVIRKHRKGEMSDIPAECERFVQKLIPRCWPKDP
jgi:hypothetical protein